MIRPYFRKIFIMKIGNLIVVRFYSGLQKLKFKWVHYQMFCKFSCQFSFTIVTFYIRAGFWKKYTEWLNFKII